MNSCSCCTCEGLSELRYHPESRALAGFCPPWNRYVPVRTEYRPVHTCTYRIHTKIMSCMLDTNGGTDSVLEHNRIHVTHAEYCFPQAYHIKQHPLQYFCKHSTYQYVPSTYSGKIVRTSYVLGVNSMYYVCTSTYSYNSNSHFISGTITLAAVTSLLPMLVRHFAGRILPI
jgi:hypothetical protein